MGTPDFAVPSLKKLIESKNHNVKAIFTQAPKPKGRGMKLSASPVHQVALENEITIYHPKSLKKEEASDIIQSIDADVIIVVAYGLIIPSNILSTKKYGCINVHPSNLPKHRGAAPLQRTIIEGDNETAVCIMYMDEGIDTGDVIIRKNFSLSPRVTLQELHDKCAQLGSNLLIKVLDNIDNLPRHKQKEEGATYAHKLTKAEGKITWSDDAYKIDCKVRGMNPWPGAWFEINNKIIKIIDSDYKMVSHSYAPSTIINDNFDVACGKGILQIKVLHPEGKRKMSGKEYLMGHSVRQV